MVTISSLSAKTAMIDTDLLVSRAIADTVDKKITYLDMRFDLQKNTKTVYARDYGAKFDGIYLIDITTTTGSPVVSSASRPFVAADVGKVFALKQANNSTTYMTRGTIVSVASGNATLSVNSTSNVAGTAQIYFGTDDTAAIQAATNAANPTDDQVVATWKYLDRGVVVFPTGMAMITGEIYPRTNVSYKGQDKYGTWLKWASTNSMAQTNFFAMFYGGRANGSTRTYYDVQFRDMRIDMSAAFTTTYSYHAKCVEMLYCVRPAAINVFFDSSPATSFGLDYVSGGYVSGCTFYRSGRLWVAGGGGGSGVDFQHQPSSIFTQEHTIIGEPLNSVIQNNTFINCNIAAVRSTNDNLTMSNARTIISNNLVISNLTQGKGIEDNCCVGAVIIGNTISNVGAGQTTPGPGGSEGQHLWAGIMTIGGQQGVIANNTITGPWHDGIRMGGFLRAGSTLAPRDYLVNGNNISGSFRNGVRVEIDNTYTMANCKICNNIISNVGDSGVSITNSGATGLVTNLSLNDNQIYDTGKTTATDLKKAGVYIDTTITGFLVADNYIYDATATTTKYGISINNVAVTSALITGNHLSATTSTKLLVSGTGSLAGEVTNNMGYHLGASTITVGASPYTYTSGFTPEVVYVSGGTISSITKDGVTMPTIGAFSLGPNESIIVTYTVAPTMVKDRK